MPSDLSKDWSRTAYKTHHLSSGDSGNASRKRTVYHRPVKIAKVEKTVIRLKIVDLNDGLAHLIGFLEIEEINRSIRVSKEFRKRSKEAMKQLRVIKCPNKNRDGVMGAIINNCKKIYRLEFLTKSCLEIVSYVRIWNDLRTLCVLGDRPHSCSNLEQSLISIIASNLSQLESLSLKKVFTINEISLKPLQKLTNLSKCLISGTDHFNLTFVVTGMEAVLESCPLTYLSLPLCKSDILEAVKSRKTFRTLKILKSYEEEISCMDCWALTQTFPNLTELSLFARTPLGSRVEALNGLKRLNRLRITLREEDRIGLGLLCKFGNFNRLKRLSLFAVGNFQKMWKRLILAHPDWDVRCIK